MLPCTHGPRIAHLHGVRNYLNNYFAMYKRLTRSRIRVVLTSPTYLGVRNYLNNEFAIYTRLTCSHIHADLASPNYFWLRIIKIIILPCINA